MTCRVVRKMAQGKNRASDAGKASGHLGDWWWHALLFVAPNGDNGMTSYLDVWRCRTILDSSDAIGRRRWLRPWQPMDDTGLVDIAQ
jgi:hypothetical protein